MATAQAARALHERKAGGRRMILGDGICTVFERRDVSGEGEMPRFEYAPKVKSYFAHLDFVSGTTWTTQGREDVVVDARIRILQDRRVTPQDSVVLLDCESAKGQERYEIDRVYHGRDEESGMLISDLTLRRVTAA